MNKKTVALNREQYIKIIEYLRENYNHYIADALVFEACTALRISDVLSLKLSNIVFENNRYHLQIIEKKTKKQRNFTIKAEVYDFLKDIAVDDDVIFKISCRRIQQALKCACTVLKLHNISTHSFRKFFATEIYNQNHDIYLVSQLLQHSSIAITQRYLAVSSEAIEDALNKHDALI